MFGPDGPRRGPRGQTGTDTNVGRLTLVPPDPPGLRNFRGWTRPSLGKVGGRQGLVTERVDKCCKRNLFSLFSSDPNTHNDTRRSNPILSSTSFSLSFLLAPTSYLRKKVTHLGTDKTGIKVCTWKTLVCLIGLHQWLNHSTRSSRTFYKRFVDTLTTNRKTNWILSKGGNFTLSNKGILGPTLFPIYWQEKPLVPLPRPQPLRLQFVIRNNAKFK